MARLKSSFPEGVGDTVLPQETKGGAWFGQYHLRGSILVLKDNSTTASGYIAFSTSITAAPTSAVSGTGVYIDYTGVYGLASGTKQFYLLAASGVAYAGAGAVILDSDGVRLLGSVSATPSNKNMFRIRDENDASDVMRLYTYIDTGADPMNRTNLRSLGHSSQYEASLSLEAKTADGAAHAGVATATIDLETATNKISYSTLQHRMGRWCVMAMLNKTGITDNAATDTFKITTTNESGSTDGGAYTCEVFAMVSHLATAANTNTAAIKYRGSFTRIMLGAGTGNNSAVEDAFTGTSIASAGATKDIATVVMSVVETSEYVQTVQFTIDLSGAAVATAEVTLFIRVLFSGFTTPPVISEV
jgi:hypothetical protein